MSAAEFILQPFEQLLSAGDEDEIEALGCELAGDLLAESLGRAGDECPAVVAT